MKVMSGRTMNYRLYDAIHEKKIDFTREKPMQLPQAPQIQLCSYSLADFFAKRLHRVFSH